MNARWASPALVALATAIVLLALGRHSGAQGQAGPAAAGQAAVAVPGQAGAAARDQLSRSSGEQISSQRATSSTPTYTALLPYVSRYVLPEPSPTPRPTANPGSAPPLDIVGQLGGTAWDVAVDGDYAYLAAGAAVTAYDVSNPTQPRAVARTGAFPGIVQGVALSGHYLLVAVSAGLADASTDPQNALDADRGLAVVDIADPARPRTVVSVPIPGGAK